jgi:ribose transport system substrate-binding protein
MTDSWLWRRRARLGILGIALALVGTACSSTKTSSSPSASTGANVTEAQGIVDQLEAPLAFTPPGPAINVGDAARGKTLYFVTSSLNFPFTQSVLQGMKEGAEAVGMKIVALDAKGDASTAARQLDQAISQRAAAIALMDFPTDVLRAPIQSARDAGIPVIQMFEGDPGVPSSEEKSVGVFGLVTYCYSCAGKQMAAMAVAQSKGDVNAVVVNVPEVGGAVLETEGFKTELQRLCPSCTVKSVDAPISQWSTQLPSIGASSIQDASVNFVVPVFDAMVGLMKTSMLAGGASGRVSVLSYNATVPAMQDLAKGELITGDVGSPNVWLGWGVIDQVLRALTGNEPVDEHVGNRGFTRANIAEFDLQDDSKWYGDADFRAGFLKLWGVG